MVLNAYFVIIIALICNVDWAKGYQIPLNHKGWFISDDSKFTNELSITKLIILSNITDSLRMSTVVAASTSSSGKLKVVSGALDSPNCIFLAKKIKDYGDPFKSPSIRVNGAGNASKFSILI